MCRFGFCVFIALMTFGIGSFIAYKFYLKNNEDKNSKSAQENLSPKIEANQNFVIEENAQFSPQISQENSESKKPLCRDEKILPVWNLIQKDEYFQRSQDSFKNPNCSELFEVFNFDLNQDGAKEILLRGKNPELCGATGNCGFWIFEKKGNKYRKILSDADYVDITEIGNQIMRRKTNGYQDILLKGHWNASDTFHKTFEFNGQKYVESKCLVDYYTRGTSPNPKWKFITCRKHVRLEDY